jgi:hypothetical protein
LGEARFRRSSLGALISSNPFLANFRADYPAHPSII